MARLRAAFAVTVDILGVGLVLFGVWWVFPPAAVVVAGVGCLVIRRNL